jgi:surface protein
MKIYTYDNKIMTVGGKWMEQPVQPEPEPPLPPFTIRLKFIDGVTPTFKFGSTAVQVSSSPNIWDLTYENTNWSTLLQNQSNLLEVIDAQVVGVLNMLSIFRNCASLTTVPLFDTHTVTNMQGMFDSCYELTTIPLFDTSNCTNMSGMFGRCYKVQSGALALYQQASSQATVPSHSQTFRDCGRDTTTGAAELAQIPSSWGGNA